VGRARIAAAAAALAACALAPAAEAGSSLPSGPGPRPGPDLLYAEPQPAPPQLQNAGPWRAEPILVSGASAYRDGEFLYQDFLYDDHGAALDRDPTDARIPGHVFSLPNGSYTYPTRAPYAANAADLVELRVKPLARETAFRLTLNTLNDPSLVAATIAIGGDPNDPQDFPDGANVRAPAALFLTVRPGEGGMVGELVRAGSGERVEPAPRVSVSSERRQIEVRVPRAAWDPGRERVRLAAGVGLWDAAAGRYLLPRSGSATETQPGGGGGGDSTPAAFFNVAFRHDEPLPRVSDLQAVFLRPAWWRDAEQGARLEAGDVTGLHAVVDFDKLAAREDDDSGIPRTGPINRILASRFETQPGVDYSSTCFPGDPYDCKGTYQGRLQPYAIYVPRTPKPRAGYGLTLLLHSLTANHNQYSGSRHQSQFGERGAGSIVLTNLGRGPDNFFASYGAADLFEVWADVARHYDLDPDWTAISGYSMGGIGSFKIAEQFPDLFARLFSGVGYSDDRELVATLRNIPVLMWNVYTDELVPPPSYRPTADELDELGYRYEIDEFLPPLEHNSLAYNDEYAPAAAFLGSARVDRDPPHVTYVYDPDADHPELGFAAGHAYWVADVEVRDRGADAPGDAHGRVDAVSHASGAGDPEPSETARGAGALTGGTIPTAFFTRQWRTWGPAPRHAPRDALSLETENVRSLTVAVRRAGLTCDAAVELASDGPVELRLAGCGTALSFPAAGSRPAVATRARCGRRGRLTLALAGAETGEVESAEFLVGARSAGRDTSVPLRRTVRLGRRDRRARTVGARVTMRDGRTATLRQRAPRCMRRR
jgi:hypothetical protein